MDKFYIITNNDKDKDFQITNEIVSYLKKMERNVRFSRRNVSWKGHTIIQIRN